MKPAKPNRKTGIAHFIAATGYSIAGARRLSRESAARHELLLGAVGMAALAFFGASLGHYIGFVILLAALIAIEALNTALEEVVNHLSPEWSQMAKEAKDLGSLAVGLMVIANLVYLGAVIVGFI